MPAPDPWTRASVSASPASLTVQLSCHSVFSTEWIHDRVNACVASIMLAAPAAMHSPTGCAPRRPQVRSPETPVVTAARPRERYQRTSTTTATIAKPSSSVIGKAATSKPAATMANTRSPMGSGPRR